MGAYALRNPPPAEAKVPLHEKEFRSMSQGDAFGWFWEPAIAGRKNATPKNKSRYGHISGLGIHMII